MILIMISLTSDLRGAIIVLDNVMKIWIELIKSKNDNATKKFYLMQSIFKSRTFGSNIEHLKKSRIKNNVVALVYELFA